MYQNNVKSATTAGLLGIFLGAFGAHNWYLGDKKKGTIHVSLTGGGILVLIIVNVIFFILAQNNLTYAAASYLGVRPWWYILLSAVAGLAISASEIWGAIEGIIILSQGDAGLAQKGYAVAQPMNGYNQPMNNGYGMPNNMNSNMNNGFNQPMSNGYGMPNNMNGNMNNGYGMPNNMNGNMNNGFNQPMDGNNMNNMNNNGGNENGQ